MGGVESPSHKARFYVDLPKQLSVIAGFGKVTPTVELADEWVLRVAVSVAVDHIPIDREERCRPGPHLGALTAGAGDGREQSVDSGRRWGLEQACGRLALARDPRFVQDLGYEPGFAPRAYQDVDVFSGQGAPTIIALQKACRRWSTDKFSNRVN